MGDSGEDRANQPGGWRASRLGASNRYFDDGREIELLHWLYNQPNLNEIRGNPEKVIKLIDEFDLNKHFLMNVGSQKGKVVTDLIAEHKPQTMVELGGYVGYSAVLFGDALRRAGGKRYLSLEKNPEFAAVTTMVVDLAGLSDVVKVIVGSSDQSLYNLFSSGQLSHVELLFIDHYKPAYTTDLKLCEQLGKVIPGSLLIADNVLVPGAPQYLKYVRSSVEEKRNSLSSKTEHELEGVDKEHVAQFDKQKPAFAVTGDPNLIYETRINESEDARGIRDGLEITKCVGVAK